MLSPPSATHEHTESRVHTRIAVGKGWITHSLAALAHEPWQRRPKVHVGYDVLARCVQAVLAEQGASHKVRNAHREEKAARARVQR